MTAAIVPTGIVSYSLIHLSEQQLIEKMQRVLENDLEFFQQQQQQLETQHLLLADGLAEEIETARINLATAKSDRLKDVVQSSTDRDLTASFYLLTDAQGKTVAHKIRSIANLPDENEALPPENQTVPPTYHLLTVPVGIDLSQLAIVQAALQNRRSFTGHEILNAAILKQLGLDQQASIGIRSQKKAGLSKAKQPLPEGIYDLEQGKVGIATIAVKPIVQNNQIVGTAIVGTLLNRNTALVDTIRHKTNSPTATLFAYDWRVSTNIPTLEGNRRAIGTRVAREVAETVLQQGKPFIGDTNIVGRTYMTAYAPLFDHRIQLNPSEAKPIGILYVGKPNTKAIEATHQLLLVGYGISGGVLILIGFLALPLANFLSGSMQRLTEFAQQVGCFNQSGIDTSLLQEFEERQDEIGILARELHQMTRRIETNLTTISRSESQFRDQTLQLQEALEKLQHTQLQLIQTEKMSGLGQLTAGLAHEINNPVSFIHGNVGYAIDYITDLFKLLNLYEQEHSQPSAQLKKLIDEIDLDFVEEDLPKLLTSMKTGTQRIRDIVLSLRNFSRLDEAEKKVVDIHVGLESTLLILQHRLQSIEVIQHYGDLPEIECYPGLLNQVLMNILNNAIDALAEQNAPRITITTQRESNVIVIRIADNGTGMNDTVKSKLFDPFFTTKPVGKGTGMGLSVSYQIIVEKHGGQLNCSSKLGEGSEFRIELSIEPATN
ncbi:two-component sensor histidine kinase [Leptolyngbya sp. NIES-3755]|nr:two-component sensor histidine kinase [Leptolyngbya sp. NIES-3755]